MSIKIQYNEDDMTRVIARYFPRTISMKTAISSWVLAGLFIILACTQLITYEKFVPIIQNYQVFDGVFGKIIAAFLVTSEVFALPFILRMRLSPLFRLFSLYCAYAASGVWIGLGVWAITVNPPTIGSGVIGSLGPDLPVWSSFFIGVILLILVLRVHRLFIRDERLKK